VSGAANVATQPRVAIYLVMPTNPERGKMLDAKLVAFARPYGPMPVRLLERADRCNKRPQLQRLLERAKARAFDVLVVGTIGALAGSRPKALRIALDLEALGVRVVSHDEPWLDLSAPLVEWVAADEDRRLRKSARAIEAKRQRGERVGELPYGYQSTDGVTVEPNRDEQRVIAEARRLFDDGQSLRAIAKTLTDAGFTTRRGGSISHGQIGRIVRAAHAPRPSSA
jgi:site-specific DNA recombinase